MVERWPGDSEAGERPALQGRNYTELYITVQIERQCKIRSCEGNVLGFFIFSRLLSPSTHNANGSLPVRQSRPMRHRTQ
jgi:hypothetical protein